MMTLFNRNRDLHRLENSSYEYVDEPILIDDLNNRFVFRPTSEDLSPVMTFYKKQERLFWVVEEIRMGKDTSDWESLSEDKKNLLKGILAFFACSDGIVNENIGINFFEEIRDSSIRMYYTKQMSIESVHAETYTMLLNHYIKDKKENDDLFNAVNGCTNSRDYIVKMSNAVKQKAEWAMKWMKREGNTFDIRLIAFSIVEGVFFSGCFCIIFWFKNQGLLPGLTQSNELISRDEGIHTDFACMLHNKYIKNKTHQIIVHEMFKDAFDVECNFIDNMFTAKLIGINADLMKQYIKLIINRQLEALGYDILYPGVTNPFPFMDNISVEGKTNFFEKETTEYNNKTGQVDNLVVNVDDDI